MPLYRSGPGATRPRKRPGSRCNQQALTPSYPNKPETVFPFEPDIILIFAGCDSHQVDCSARITNWVEDDFKTLTRSVTDLANKVSCPILSSQGGGYKLAVNIPTTVAHVEVLANYYSNPE